MANIDNIINHAKKQLKDAKISTFELDVRIIFCHSFQITQEDFFLNRDQIHIIPEKLTIFYDNIARRQKREPVSHIIEKKEFFGNIFYVNSDVLDPRPDSETLIALMLEIYQDKSQPLKFLELGVGSGCLILTLLKFFQNSTAIAIDINKKAIEVAKKNAKNLQIAKQLKIYHSDLFSKIPKSEKFDVIISNPPYIPTKDIAYLEDEVKKFDQTTALDGGDDGLDFYRKIANKAKNFLAENAIIILEIGQGQENDIINIFENKGLLLKRKKTDLSGIIRCVVF